MTWPELEPKLRTGTPGASPTLRANTLATRTGVTTKPRLLTTTTGRGHHGNGRMAGDQRTGAMCGRAQHHLAREKPGSHDLSHRFRSLEANTTG